MKQKFSDRSLPKNWWLFRRPATDLHEATENLERFLAIHRVGKHRFYTWIRNDDLPSNSLTVIASSSNTVYGILNSSIHTLWLARAGSAMGGADDAQFTNESFETFPFPIFEGEDLNIQSAASQIQRLREQFRSKGQALTDVYNQVEKLREQNIPQTTHPAFPLLLAHRDLDKAVYAAYGWDYPLEDEEILERLLALNLERAALEKEEAA